MIPVIVNLMVGWLLHFVGLETMFKNLLGFNEGQYYLMFLIFGVIVFITNRIKYALEDNKMNR